MDMNQHDLANAMPQTQSRIPFWPRVYFEEIPLAEFSLTA